MPPEPHENGTAPQPYFKIYIQTECEINSRLKSIVCRSKGTKLELTGSGDLSVPELGPAVEAAGGARHHLHQVVVAPLPLHLLHQVLNVAEAVGNGKLEEDVVVAAACLVGHLHLDMIQVYKILERN